MEYALWNGQQLSATTIGKEYELEKQIRHASARGELCCQDPTCQSKVVKYCHGKIRSPYFAHLENTDCDYAEYDRSKSEEIANLCMILYDVLSNQGFQVQKEVKLLAHHYSHLVVEEFHRQKTAIEILKRNFSVRKADYLTDEYEKAGAFVAWLEIGNADASVRENATYFAERFALNENSKTLLVVDKDLTRVAEYRMDSDSYVYQGRIILPEKELFCVRGSVNDLTFENGIVTLHGYENKYNEWKEKRRLDFEKKCVRMERQLKAAEEERERRQEFKQWQENEQNSRLETEWEQLNPLLEGANEVVFDSTGNRVIKCKQCGKIGHDKLFAVYGGMNSLNLGICKECQANKIQ